MNGWFVVTETQIYTFPLSRSQVPQSDLKSLNPLSLPSQEDPTHSISTLGVTQVNILPPPHLLIVIFHNALNVITH